ncbi:hypothetical protein F4782DRAFT_263948 [Xylaria castorea]|nr:hypothetical protein F4782DRAFT_263948 [Xylaria castorea]
MYSIYFENISINSPLPPYPPTYPSMGPAVGMLDSLGILFMNTSWKFTPPEHHNHHTDGYLGKYIVNEYVIAAGIMFLWTSVSKSYSYLSLLELTSSSPPLVILFGLAISVLRDFFVFSYGYLFGISSIDRHDELLIIVSTAPQLA